MDRGEVAEMPDMGCGWTGGLPTYPEEVWGRPYGGRDKEPEPVWSTVAAVPSPVPDSASGGGGVFSRCAMGSGAAGAAGL